MNSKTYTPIACGDYDFLEIACMDNYELEVVMSTDTVHGRAVTTENNASGEYLVVALEDGQQQSLRADSIQKIIVKTKNARFAEHTFSPP